jgi:hypothetical protein
MMTTPRAAAGVLAAVLATMSSATHHSAWGQQPELNCPQANAAKYPFDNTYVQFDSIAKLSSQQGNILYCVRVSGAQRSYLVNWPDIQWYDVGTRPDGSIEGNSPETSRRIELVQSEVYIGANQRKFTPTIRKEISQAKELLDTAKTLFTRFFGSIPSSRDLSGSANFVPVDLQFTATYEDGTARIEFSNEERGETRAFKFTFADDISRRIPELRDTFTIGPNRNSAKYRISGKASAERAGITFLNSDNEQVAAFAIVIYAPSGQ